MTILKKMEDNKFEIYTADPMEAYKLVENILIATNDIKTHTITDMSSMIADDHEAYDVTVTVYHRK